MHCALAVAVGRFLLFIFSYASMPKIDGLVSLCTLCSSPFLWVLVAVQLVWRSRHFTLFSCLSDVAIAGFAKLEHDMIQ